MTDRAIEAITFATRVIIVGLGALVVVVVAAEVFFRYVVHHSLFFADELARYMFVWVTFLAASLALRRGEHIGLEVGYIYLPPRVAGVLQLIAHLLVATFLLAFFFSSLALLPAMWDRYTTTLGVRVFWVFVALPVGSLLMLVQLLPLLRAAVQRIRKAEQQSSGRVLAGATEEEGA